MAEQKAAGEVEAPQQEMTFDQAILSTMRKTVQDCLMQYPELRSVAVICDYKGALNEAQVEKALWIGTGGAVKDIGAIMGGINNTLMVLDQMFMRIVEIQKAAAENLGALSSDLAAKSQQLNEVRTERDRLEEQKASLEKEVNRLRKEKAGGAGPGEGS